VTWISKTEHFRTCCTALATYDAATDFVVMTDKVQIMLLVKHMKFLHLFGRNW